MRRWLAMRLLHWAFRLDEDGVKAILQLMAAWEEHEELRQRIIRRMYESEG